MSATLKNLFVYVPGSAVDNFKQNHTGSGVTSSDNYYDKVSFLSGSGEIAARGELFGLSTEFKDRLGLTNDITTSNTLMTYIAGLGSQLDTLNANDSTDGSVDKKIKTAIADVIGTAPTALDTLGEIAAWIDAASGNTGSYQAMALTLASVPSIIDKLGTYTGSTYSGAYLFAHNAAVEEAAAKVATLTYTDAAVTGQYVSAVNESNGIISVVRADLPTLSVDSTANSGSQYVTGLSVSGNTITASYAALPTLSVALASQDYVTVNDHEITLVITDLGSSSGLNYTSANDAITYNAVATTVSTDGLITASAVYNRIHATETFLATTLTSLDSRIQATVTGATGALDSVQTLTATENGTSYGSITIVQKDGLLATTAEDGTTTASFSINKTNILAKTEATVSSPTTGTGANEYIAVNVVTENHDVKSVTVEFDPWEVYTAS